jgi:predicted transposase/invertase (TIGR01784 family)
MEAQKSSDRMSPTTKRRSFCYNVSMATDTFIRPTSDLFIAALWSAPEREPILRSLLNGVMTDIGQPKIVKATVQNPLNIQDYDNDKEIRLDVRVEDETETKYNIEVQTDSHPEFWNRMLFYWAEIYCAGLKRGDGYDKLYPVRSIVITKFPVCPELKRLHTIFEARSRENPAVLLSEHFQMHVLRLGDLIENNLAGLEQFGLTLQRWMQFWVYGSDLEEDKMSAMLQDVPEVQAAYNEYKRFTSDPAMRERMEARERFQIDKKLDRAEAERRGEAKGRTEGRTERNIEVARNLKRLGASPSMIAEATGLSLSEIERLN